MMKKKFIAVLSAAVITAGAIGGVAFASSDNSSKGSEQINIETIQENNNFNNNSANNPAKDTYKDMVKLMRENGFKDAARFMQTGDFDAMTDYMDNLTHEDFDQMTNIMNENGYEAMGKMMESVGRDGMIKMHKSMGSMMGGF